MPRRPPKFESVAPPQTDPSVWADGAVKVTAAARKYGVGRDKLYELMKSGRLVWSRPSRDRLIAVRSILDYLASGVEPETPRRKP